MSNLLCNRFHLVFLFAITIFLNLNLGATEIIKPDVKRVKVGQIEIAYYIRGTGKPLVMINGFKGTMSSWDPALLEDLEKHYQLILFDNRGVGFSTDTVENLTTITQMADDTAGLIKALGLEKADVLGWSMGARIGQQLVIRNPELIRKLILCAPNPGGRHQAKRSQKGTIPNHQSEEEFLTLLFPDTKDGLAAKQEYISRLSKASANGTIPNDTIISKQTDERQYTARGQLWDTSEENYAALPTIKTLTLLVDGIDDLINASDNVRIMADRIPLAWSAYFEGGHAFLFQQHERFADLVTLFLE